MEVFQSLLEHEDVAPEGGDGSTKELLYLILKLSSVKLIVNLNQSYLGQFGQMVKIQLRL